MKYIDTDKLIVEIKRLDKENKELLKSGGSIGREFLFGIGAGYADIIKIIDSLQQEQPDKYETALEKAREWMPNVNQGGHAILISIFPELGEGLDPRYGGRKQDQPEVDIEKEITEHAINMPHCEFSHDSEDREHEEWAMKEFRYFYELGLNARKQHPESGCPEKPNDLLREQPEVDLEKEIKNYLATKCAGDDEPSVSEIARHFYELGSNARKED